MATSAEPLHLDGSTHALDPKIRTVWAIAGTIPGAIIGIAWLVIAIVSGDDAALLVFPVLFTLVWAGAAVTMAHLRFDRWSWAAWHDAVDLRHGVIVAHQSVVPYHRIQQIDIHRGPVERSLGLATLILRTAAATTDARLPGIPTGSADALRHELLRRSGLDDAV